MKHLILESTATGHQKLMLSLFFIVCFILGGLTAVGFAISDDPLNFGLIDIIFLLLFPLSFVILAIRLSKQGLSLTPGQLLQTTFLYGRPIKSKEIKLNGITDLSILKFNMAHKLAFGAAPNPEQTETMGEFRICLLNENHTKRQVVATVRNSARAIEVADIICQELKLRKCSYNPPRSRGRKRR